MIEIFDKKMDWGTKPEFFGPKHIFREKIVNSKIRKYFKQGVVLDAGFGSCSLITKILSNKNLEIYGVDASKKFLEYGQSKLKNFRNINLSVGNITKLKFKDNKFDYLVSTEVLEHVMDDKKAVSEFYRVLKKGGLCIITVPINPKAFDETDKWSGHFRRYTFEQINNLFQKQGFRLVEYKKFGYILLYLYHHFFYRKIIHIEKDINIKGPLTRFIINLASNFLLLDNVFKIGSPLNLITVYKKI